LDTALTRWTWSIAGARPSTIIEHTEVGEIQHDCPLNFRRDVEPPIGRKMLLCCALVLFTFSIVNGHFSPYFAASYILQLVTFAFSLALRPTQRDGSDLAVVARCKGIFSGEVPRVVIYLIVDEKLRTIECSAAFAA
jgi:hypothetical protein